MALNAVGTARYRVGDHDLGRDCLLRALAHAEEQNDGDAILSALNNLCAGGLVAHHDHDEAGLAEDATAAAAEAVNYARRAVAQARTMGDAYRLAAVTCNLGEALGLRGDPDTALVTLAEVESSTRQHGFVALELHVRRVIGEMLVRAGRLEAAVDHRRAFDSAWARRGASHRALRAGFPPPSRWPVRSASACAPR